MTFSRGKKSSRVRKSRRVRKNNKNKRLKKYGGTQPYIFVTFFGEKQYQPDVEYKANTTIGELVRSKNGYLYHHGILISSYPNEQLVRNTLPSDHPHFWKYNINQIMSKEPPPERIPAIPVTPYKYDSDYDPNDDYPNDDYSNDDVKAKGLKQEGSEETEPTARKGSRKGSRKEEKRILSTSTQDKKDKKDQSKSRNNNNNKRS